MSGPWFSALALLFACFILAWKVWPGVRPKLSAEDMAQIDWVLAASRPQPHPVLLLHNRRLVRVPLRLIRR